MTKIKTDAAIYAKLETLLKPYDKVSRNPSCDFLTWFLETIYRLDEIEAQDAVCDQKDDGGIDALLVDDGSRQIVLFQAKRRQANKTLGDNDLKHFVGSLKQFESRKTVEALLASDTIDEGLKKLVKGLDIAQKLDDGFTLQPIFVTNVAAAAHAHSYVSGANENIDLWDLVRLQPVLKRLEHDWFIETPCELYADGSVMQFAKGNEINLVFAAVKAKQLIKLPGIEDTTLFAQNVRLGLGSTRVNKEIVASIEDQTEHQNFLTFHNGLTIVAKDISVDKKKVTIKNFSVCNGCQSLLSFNKHKNALTNKLAVLVRIVRVGDGRESAETIAHRTNNQNAISLRDLNSNDSTQLVLAKTFNEQFGKYSKYAIKRGEAGSKDELSNELAGRLLLSVYVREPWSAHQKYKIFGELESSIFSYKVDAARIRFVQLLDETAAPYVKKLKHAQIARYSLTRFLFIFFVSELLRQSIAGRKLLDKPLSYLRTTKANAKEAKVVKELRSLCAFVVVELDYIFGTSEENKYDYKSNFKSKQQVSMLKDRIAKEYEKDLDRDKQKPFKLP